MSDLTEILKSGTGQDGQTTGELLDALGQEDTAFFRQSLLRKLKAEIKAGRVEVGTARRFRIDGRPHNAPVYRLKG